MNFFKTYEEAAEVVDQKLLVIQKALQDVGGLKTQEEGLEESESTSSEEEEEDEDAHDDDTEREPREDVGSDDDDDASLIIIIHFIYMYIFLKKF